MRLTRLVTRGFRNLVDVDVDLDAPFVVLHGPNAQGKTNALEALWYATTLRPLVARRPTELVGWDAPSLSVAVWSEADLQQHRLVELEQGRRTLTLDGARCTSLHEYFADLRAIAFVPSDGRILTEGPELRRRWMDRAAFTANPAHLDVVRATARVLANKARVLRDVRPDPVLLDTLDDQLATLGADLVARRQTLLDELVPHVDRVVSQLSGRVHTGFSMVMRTEAVGTDRAGRRASLLLALARARPQELRRQRTLVGPQLDEVAFALDGRPARRFASRGQVRTLVLSMKLAELLAAHRRGRVPIFLVDDLSSELDRARTRRLIALLADVGAQVFATTTDPGHLHSEQVAARKIEVEQGTLRIVSG